MTNIKFDWTFNIGQVASVAILAIAIITGWVNLTNKVTMIDVRTQYLTEAVTEVKVNQAVNRTEARSELQQLRNDVLGNESRRQKEADRVTTPSASVPPVVRSPGLHLNPRDVTR